MARPFDRSTPVLGVDIHETQDTAGRYVARAAFGRVEKSNGRAFAVYLDGREPVFKTKNRRAALESLARSVSHGIA